MEVTCEHCKAKFNIPDEKIPRDQVVKIGCPRCKNKITIDTRETTEEKSATPEQESKPTEQQGEKAYDYGDFSDDEDLGFLEEGTRLAISMVGSTEGNAKIKAAVSELGYKFVSSPNSRDAIGKLRFHHFDLVILSDGFDGQPIENSPILNYLNHVSMSVRRRIFLALIGDKFKTMDNMMAFAMSANLVVCSEDLDKLTSILKRNIADNEKFYKVFMDTLVEVGKA